MSDAQPTHARPLNIANLLTFTRLGLSPVFAAVFLWDTFAGAVLCLVIALTCEMTDLFDGRFARSRNQVTDLGKILDPLADSISRLTAFVCFVYGGQAPLLCVVFILYRDSVVSTVRTFCAFRGKVLSARFSGKLKANVQGLAIFVILGLRALTFHTPDHAALFLRIDHGLMLIVAVVTVASGIDYCVGTWPVVSKER